MSRLAVGTDDHPEAALKHYADARVLHDSGRHDGAVYLSGYTVECCLKAVLLHDQCFDATTGAHDPALLARWHRTFSRRPYGHDLAALLGAAVGPQGARYLPPLDPGDSVMTWTETMRYSAAGRASSAEGEAFVAWAELAADSVVRMQLDGVL